ncbi:MAG: GNAT family N-acetyltransferase [Rhodoluna sp.]|nr:GNAT family N-acetyltransferase [Rhodoluna sp.]
MKLRPLTLADEAQALQAHSELAMDNFEFLLGYSEGIAWPEYLEVLSNEFSGTNLKEGRVPATFMIAEIDGELVGRTSIRHELNDFLFSVGGHIGYGVRPNFRRQGYATEILKQSLTYINQLGITEVLVTCRDDNVGSFEVIQSQGGILENKVEYEGALWRRYWIKKFS